MPVRPVPRETGRSGIMRAMTDLLTAERVLFFRMNSGDRIVPGKNGKRYRIKGPALMEARIKELEAEVAKCKSLAAQGEQHDH